MFTFCVFFSACLADDNTTSVCTSLQIKLNNATTDFIHSAGSIAIGGSIYVRLHIKYKPDDDDRKARTFKYRVANEYSRYGKLIKFGANYDCSHEIHRHHT